MECATSLMLQEAPDGEQAKIVAVDLQEMAPLPGVQQLKVPTDHLQHDLNALLPSKGRYYTEENC